MRYKYKRYQYPRYVASILFLRLVELCQQNAKMAWAASVLILEIQSHGRTIAKLDSFTYPPRQFKLINLRSTRHAVYLDRSHLYLDLQHAITLHLNSCSQRVPRGTYSNPHT